MWILVLVTLSTQGQLSYEMQEFSSKSSCNEAGKTVVAEVVALQSENFDKVTSTHIPKFICVKK